jgi:uncharacterized membrane protein YqhA
VDVWSLVTDVDVILVVGAVFIVGFSGYVVVLSEMHDRRRGVRDDEERPRRPRRR